METLALEDFKRKQRNSSASPLSSSSQSPSTMTFNRSSLNDQFPSPAQPPQRRTEATVLHNSATAPDLISFSGPDAFLDDSDDLLNGTRGTSRPVSGVPDKHTSFVQYVDQIHQMSAQHQQQYLTNAALVPFIRSPIPIPIAGPAGLQLMPYQAPPPQQTAPPLTADNLQKLYNSPYYPGTGYSRFPSQHHPQQQQQFIPQGNVAAFPTVPMRSASVPPSATGEYFCLQF